VDTTKGTWVTTTYTYDAKGMRIVKDGPYGKSIYIDTGYVASSNAPGVSPMIESNHVFVGNTSVSSIVKHKEEQIPATYYQRRITYLRLKYSTKAFRIESC
jgi:hypothetical protein